MVLCWFDSRKFLLLPRLWLRFVSTSVKNIMLQTKIVYLEGNRLLFNAVFVFYQYFSVYQHVWEQQRTLFQRGLPSCLCSIPVGLAVWYSKLELHTGINFTKHVSIVVPNCFGNQINLVQLESRHTRFGYQNSKSLNPDVPATQKMNCSEMLGQANLVRAVPHLTMEVHQTAWLNWFPDYDLVSMHDATWQPLPYPMLFIWHAFYLFANHGWRATGNTRARAALTASCNTHQREICKLPHASCQMFWCKWRSIKFSAANPDEMNWGLLQCAQCSHRFIWVDTRRVVHWNAVQQGWHVEAPWRHAKWQGLVTKTSKFVLLHQLTTKILQNYGSRRHHMLLVCSQWAKASQVASLKLLPIFNPCTLCAS